MFIGFRLKLKLGWTMEERTFVVYLFTFWQCPESQSHSILKWNALINLME